MSEIQRWSPGDHVVLRYVGHDNGWAVGWPQIVVEDSAERLVLFQPGGTDAENVQVGEDRRSELMPAGSFRSQWPRFYRQPLGLMRAIPEQAAHAVEMYFSAGEAPPHSTHGLTLAGPSSDSK